MSLTFHGGFQRQENREERGIRREGERERSSEQRRDGRGEDHRPLRNRRTREQLAREMGEGFITNGSMSS